MTSIKKVKVKPIIGERFVIIPLTSKKLGEIYRYEVRTFVDSKNGKALIDQVKTVDKKRLIKKLGQLTEKEIDAIQEKLLAIFDLWEYLKKREIVPRYPTKNQPRQNYDYLIIDGPAKISKESLEIAKQANLVIQPVRPSLDDLNPAIREFNGLFKAGISKNKLTFLINAVGSPAMEKATRDYLSPAGYYSFPLALEEKVSYQEAQNQGLSIGEVKYKRLQEQY
ncbi:7578_t:CDS:2 [Entrophospora sp. SA101]|nr:7578_t:CDS:2 [Entrophospora sp. SA101]